MGQRSLQLHRIRVLFARQLPEYKLKYKFESRNCIRQSSQGTLKLKFKNAFFLQFFWYFSTCVCHSRIRYMFILLNKFRPIVITILRMQFCDLISGYKTLYIVDISTLSVNFLVRLRKKDFLKKLKFCSNFSENSRMPCWSVLGAASPVSPPPWIH